MPPFGPDLFRAACDMGLESFVSKRSGKTPVDGLLAPRRVALVSYFGTRSEAHCSLHLKEFVKLSCSADRLLGYQIDARLSRRLPAYDRQSRACRRGMVSRVQRAKRMNKRVNPNRMIEWPSGSS